MHFPRVSALCLSLLLTLRASAAEIVINPGRISFDTQASTLRLPDGSGFAVWKSYYQSKERVLCRQLSKEGEPQLITQLNERPSIVDQPILAASPNGKHLWAFWSERIDERWRIYGREFHRSRWLPAKQFSAGEADAIKPAALARNDGTVLIGWHEFTDGNPVRVRVRSRYAEHWSEAVTISRTEQDSFRLALVDHDDEIWAFWDQYNDLNYNVCARPLRNPHGPIEDVIPPMGGGIRSLTPRPLSSQSQGLCVAWLRLQDVIGGDGVVDMIHTGLVSVRQNGTWKMVGENTPDFEGAVMLNGLLPDLRRGKRYPSGYAGKRRHPMLLDGPNETWLIWERKSAHGGSGTKTYGQLLGRPFRNGTYGQTMLLYDKLIDYALTQPAEIRDGQFTVTGSKLPRGWMRPHHQVTIQLKNAKPFEKDDWRTQFRAVDLPKLATTKRHSIQADGKTYNLYWADLHCHSGLTGDAEGEPDEIILYGRDRAKLDVMVLQDNDDVHGCLLTEGEYYMGMLHSQRFTRPGSFIALPGYEWTQRKTRPGYPFDPWKSVYEQSMRGSYPNHRTIIYPSTGGPIVRYTEVGGNYETMTRTVEKYGGIVNSQHRAFDITDSPAEANMEVTSCWGIYIHDVPKKFHGELDRGRRLGFVGCSDSHRRNPGLCGGLTGIYAEELTDEAILRALREHRCFASNGSKIVVDSRLEGQLSDSPIASESRPLTLTLHSIGTKPIIKAILVTNGGKHVKSFTGNGTKELKIKHRLDGLAAGDHWYYWEIHQEGRSTQYTGNISVAQGHLAWSSPHFVTIK